LSILCYHAVDPLWHSPLSVSPEEFEAHCAWLARHRTVVPLDVAVEHMSRSGRLPRSMVALTFDDGFAQLHDYVFPVLAKHRLPATLFVVAKTLTPEGQTVDWVDTPPPWPLETLTVEQILDARAAGVAVASHSWSHRTLTEVEEDACRVDLATSREFLSDMLHEGVTQLAYPRGKHDGGVRRAAEAAGYRHSFALPEAREQVGPHALPRVGVFPGNGTWTLRGKTHPRYLAVRHSKVFPTLRTLLRRPR
jgi:peptidoglycan/xylan/chitin deacetylase (PgdA/CDA1 family)